MVPGQPAGLSKEACLYAGADWLSSSVSQRVARSQVQLQFSNCSATDSDNVFRQPTVLKDVGVQRGSRQRCVCRCVCVCVGGGDEDL